MKNKKNNQLIETIKKFKNIQQKNSINIDTNEFINLINLSLGFYKPLYEFCDLEDVKNILNKKKINKHKSWTIPILLDSKSKKKISINKYYKLKYKKKFVGLIKIKNTFRLNKKFLAKKIFNTISNSHPYVKFLSNSKNQFVCGKTFLLKSSLPKDKFFIYNQMKNKKNLSFFKNSVAFSTRNFCHVGHEFLHKLILEKNKNLTICIIENDKNKLNPEIVVKSYMTLKKSVSMYKKVMITKIYLPSFYAGPKEAYLQAKYFDNLGFKKFIVGRDHAGFSNLFKKYESQKIFKSLKPLKIKIIKTKEPLICSNCFEVSSQRNKFCDCKKSMKLLTIDGKNIKKLLIDKNFMKVEKFLNPHVFQYLKNNLNKIRRFMGLNYYIK